jgi:hypothetical protein
MAKAKKVKQLSLFLPDRVGLLAEVSALIAKAKVNISAICAYQSEDKAQFLIVAESNAKAKKALAALGVEVKEEDVVCVEMPNNAGELARVAGKLADAGVNINFSWATAFVGKTSAWVIKTSNNAKAITAINR